MGELESIHLETGPQPRAVIIVLHGLGADGGDFVPFAQELKLDAVGPVRFVFPHAPAMPVTINGGFRMPAWFDILGTEMQGVQDEAGMRRSIAAVDSLMRSEQQRGIPAEHMVIAGFSQGGALALAAGLRHPKRLAGIAALSAYLPLAHVTARERSRENAPTPVFMGHGQLDEVVAVQLGQASCAALRTLGYEVQWHEYPMGHSLSLEEIADFNAWLLRVLS